LQTRQDALQHLRRHQGRRGNDQDIGGVNRCLEVQGVAVDDPQLHASLQGGLAMTPANAAPAEAVATQGRGKGSADQTQPQHDDRGADMGLLLRHRLSHDYSTARG
jgi:hypothetical protein